MVVIHEFGDVLTHDGFVEFFVFLLVALDEESSGLPQQDVDHCHVEEVLGCSDVRALDSVSEEDVGHDQEVDVAPMGGNDDDGPVGLLVVVLQLAHCHFVNDDLLINGSEDFMQKPGKHSDRTHRIIAEHLHAHFLCNFVQLLLGLFIRSRSIF